MEPTPYPHINALLHTLQSEMRRILGPKLVGLYLYGSLVTGDFDNVTSDIDLLAVTSADIDDQDFRALHRMHDDFADRNSQWRDRIEVHYLSVAALRTFKTRTSPMAVISPGEPFHIIQSGNVRVVNWYVVQEKGVALFGPSPREFIDPISRDEFVEAVRGHVRQWREWVQPTVGGQGSQAYAILTLCRAFYTCKHGEQVSKLQAARAMQRYFPQWAPLIDDALAWRARSRQEQGDPAVSFPETARFVDFVVDEILQRGQAPADSR